MARIRIPKKEIIYPIIFDGDKTQSWGMAAIIIGARGAEDKDVLLAHSGVDQGWAGFRATSNLVHLFDFQMMKSPKLLRFKINVVFFMIKDALSTLLPVYPELLKLKDGVYSNSAI